MAKEYDPYVIQLMGIKSIISQARSYGLVCCFDADAAMVYIQSNDGLPIERFIHITDPTMDVGLLKNLLVNVPEFTSEMKYVRKTRSVGQFIGWKTGAFEGFINVRSKTSDGEHEWKINCLTKAAMNNFMRTYQILGRDEALSGEILGAITNPTHWDVLSTEDLDSLRNNELLMVELEDGLSAMISKAIFGNIKKTQSIELHLLDEEKDNFLVLFKQVEDGYNVHHICRFLKTEE